MDSIAAFKSNDEHHRKQWLFPFRIVCSLSRNFDSLFLEARFSSAWRRRERGAENIFLEYSVRSMLSMKLLLIGTLRMILMANGVMRMEIWIYTVVMKAERVASSHCYCIYSDHVLAGLTKRHSTTGSKCWQCGRHVLSVEYTLSGTECKTNTQRPFAGPTLIHQVYAWSNWLNTSSLMRLQQSTSTNCIFLLISPSFLSYFFSLFFLLVVVCLWIALCSSKERYFLGQNAICEFSE